MSGISERRFFFKCKKMTSEAADEALRSASGGLRCLSRRRTAKTDSAAFRLGKAKISRTPCFVWGDKITVYRSTSLAGKLRVWAGMPDA